MTQDLVVRFVNYVPEIIAATLVLSSAVSKFLVNSALLAAVNTRRSCARAIAEGVQLQFRDTVWRSLMGGAIAFGFVARDLARECV